MAALFVVARAVEKTGAIQPLLRRTMAGTRTPRRALARLLAPVMGASAFLDNTPASGSRWPWRASPTSSCWPRVSSPPAGGPSTPWRRGPAGPGRGVSRRDPAPRRGHRAGQADLVLDLRNNSGLRSAQYRHAQVFHGAGHAYFEAVVGAASPLVGATLNEVRFRSRYQAAVLGIHRAGEPVRSKLGMVPLQVGDTLLLLSDRGFRDRWRDRADFLTVAAMDGLAPTTSRQAWIVGTVLVGTRVLTPTEARRALDLNVIILIAASFGLGRALEVTGLAQRVAEWVVAVFGGLGPAGAYLGIVLAVLALAELITNNAAVVLVFPIAMATAAVQGLDARVLALSMAVTASATTPAWGPRSPCWWC